VAEVQQTDPSRPIRPTPKARATRARLIETAADAFVDDGYGATSVRDIAERAGLTSGAIYGHFSNKAHLLGEAVRLRLTEDLEHRGTFEEADLAGWLAHNFRDYKLRRELRALIVEGAAAARTDDEVRELLYQVVHAKEQEWASDYRGVWEREGLDPDIDHEGVLLLLLAAEMGMGVLEALDVELPAPDVLATIIRKLVGSLEAQGPGASG
jgi:AcrR family transcriptional regulator